MIRVASPPPFNKRRALQQFIARNPNVGLKKRGPGATGSALPPGKQVGTSSAYKNGLAAETRKQQPGGATAVATQDYKNRLAAADARKRQSSGPKKPGLPGARRFKNNAPFARY